MVDGPDLILNCAYLKSGNCCLLCFRQFLNIPIFKHITGTQNIVHFEFCCDVSREYRCAILLEDIGAALAAAGLVYGKECAATLVNSSIVDIAAAICGRTVCNKQVTNLKISFSKVYLAGCKLCSTVVIAYKHIGNLLNILRIDRKSLSTNFSFPLEEGFSRPEVSKVLTGNRVSSKECGNIDASSLVNHRSYFIDQIALILNIFRLQCSNCILLLLCQLIGQNRLGFRFRFLPLRKLTGTKDIVTAKVCRKGRRDNRSSIEVKLTAGKSHQPLTVALIKGHIVPVAVAIFSRQISTEQITDLKVSSCKDLAGSKFSTAIVILNQHSAVLRSWAYRR